MAAQELRTSGTRKEARTTLRRVTALTAVLVATAATGGALVAVLSSQPASRPTPVHPVAIVSPSTAHATGATSAHVDDAEGGDDR
jgi:hypothetical protein